jgi:hypothetical protein
MGTYLSRTPASSVAAERRKFTFSCWHKRCQNGATSYLLSGDISGSSYTYLAFQADNSIRFRLYDGGNQADIQASDLFQDPASWYHVVLQFDSTQGTAADRVKIYINNRQLTDLQSSTYPSQDYSSWINHNVEQRINSATDAYAYYADVHLTGNQIYAPSSFGETDSTTGEWKPKTVTGLSYGTNGFHLKFENAGAMGTDSSGNNNTFTVNNAGTNPQVTDTPSNNFANFNPLIAYLNAGSNSTRPNFQRGNLKTITTNSGKLGGTANIQINKGKWYAEFKFVESNNAGSTVESVIGVTDSPQRLAASYGKPGERAHDVAYDQTGMKMIGDSRTSFGASYTDGDIIGVAVDLDNNAIYFSKNGVFQNSGDPTSGSTKTGAIALTDPDSTVEGGYYFAVGEASSETSTHEANFGNPPFTISSGNADAAGHGNFEYAVPSGYFALCTKNLNTYG